MRRNIVFIDEKNNIELQMPVMPEEYRVEVSRETKELSMAEGGMALVMGGSELMSEEQTFWLPARPHPAASSWRAPEEILQQLNTWVEEAVPLRYVIVGAGVDLPVMLTSCRAGEQDGTTDRYVTLTIHGWRALETEQTEFLSADGKTAADAIGGTDYIVKYGDTLRSICRAYYGDENLCYKLAGYNALKNADLILPGEVLKLPKREQLSDCREVYGSLNGYKPPSSYVAAEQTPSGAMVRLTVEAAGTYAYRGPVKVFYSKEPTKFVTAKAPCTVQVLAGTKITVVAKASKSGKVVAIRTSRGEYFCPTEENGEAKKQGIAVLDGPLGITVLFGKG